MKRKADIHTKEFGKVVAIDYRKVLQVGGSRVLPLTHYLPEAETVQVIVLECDDNMAKIIIRKVNA